MQERASKQVSKQAKPAAATFTLSLYLKRTRFVVTVKSILGLYKDGEAGSSGAAAEIHEHYTLLRRQQLHRVEQLHLQNLNPRVCVCVCARPRICVCGQRRWIGCVADEGGHVASDAPPWPSSGPCLHSAAHMSPHFLVEDLGSLATLNLKLRISPSCTI
jgi:hypothetical protein